MIRSCVVCGKGFKCSPSDKTVTCSKICSIERKKLTHTGKSNDWSEQARQRQSQMGQTKNLEKGTPAAQQSPISGPFETNQNALDWILVDPSGKEYYCRNLNLWARSHCHLFDKPPTVISVRQISSGFRQVKRILQGKRNNASPTYKGWTIKI